MMSRWSDVFFVDFLVLQHPMFVRLIGPRISLLLVQSKGWPSSKCALFNDVEIGE